MNSFHLTRCCFLYVSMLFCEKPCEYHITSSTNSESMCAANKTRLILWSINAMIVSLCARIAKVPNKQSPFHRVFYRYWQLPPSPKVSVYDASDTTIFLSCQADINLWMVQFSCEYEKGLCMSSKHIYWCFTYFRQKSQSQLYMNMKRYTSTPYYKAVIRNVSTSVATGWHHVNVHLCIQQQRVRASIQNQYGLNYWSRI